MSENPNRKGYIVYIGVCIFAESADEAERIIRERLDESSFVHDVEEFAS
jgi:hypothetical protein